MSGKFSFPSAKESKGQRKVEKKWKRMMPDTYVVHDRLTARSSVPIGSVEPSPAKSSRKTQLSEAEGFVTMNLPLDKYAYSDPSFIKGVAETFLLAADCKRFANISSI